MIKYFLEIAFIQLALLLTAGSQTLSDTLHFQSIVADLHTDVLNDYFESGRNIESFSDKGHVDLDRLKMGGVDIQFFVLWPDPDKAAQSSHYLQAVRALDTLYQVLRRNPQKIQLSRSFTEIQQAVHQNKIAACIALEGGTAIDSDLGKLQYFYDRGVRYMSLTWNDSPEWASSAKDEQDINYKGTLGLNDFGKQVIRKMNALGMMIDVSHSGEKTFYDVLDISEKPVIASHSSVYSLCPNRRNLKDAQIKALAKKGGIICINFYPEYLLAPEQLEKGNASLKSVVDHIDYVVTLVGDDYVGLGSDFDGIPSVPDGLGDVSKMPLITKELVKRGYSTSSVRKILGGNLLRVFNAQ